MTPEQRERLEHPDKWSRSQLDEAGRAALNLVDRQVEALRLVERLAQHTPMCYICMEDNIKSCSCGCDAILAAIREAKP